MQTFPDADIDLSIIASFPTDIANPQINISPTEHESRRACDPQTEIPLLSSTDPRTEHVELKLARFEADSVSKTAIS
jgi:hypothetical protein